MGQVDFPDQTDPCHRRGEEGAVQAVECVFCLECVNSLECGVESVESVEFVESVECELWSVKCFKWFPVVSSASLMRGSKLCTLKIQRLETLPSHVLKHIYMDIIVI